MKQRPVDEYTHVSSVRWQPFPAEFSTGGIRWKLLHVSPEVGAWTAIYDCPKGSSFREPCSYRTRRILTDKRKNGSPRGE